MDHEVFTPSVIYREPTAALEWLERAFGFEVTLRIDGPPDQPAMGHYEMAGPDGGRIVIGAEWTDWARSPASADGANTQFVSVQLAEGIDEHCERARAAGARILEEPTDQFYGDRTYRAVDPEGHCWKFGMHVRDVSRPEAETAIGQPIVASDWQ